MVRCGGCGCAMEGIMVKRVGIRHIHRKTVICISRETYLKCE